MKVGFTGTREGLTTKQDLALYELLDKLRPKECHHGDCIGADAAFHGNLTLAGDLSAGKEYARIVIHPNLSQASRAFCRGDEVRPPKLPLERNRDIVDETDILVACPKQMVEPKDPREGGGTWATVRYARKLRRPIYIILRDGRVLTENVNRVAA